MLIECLLLNYVRYLLWNFSSNVHLIILNCGSLVVCVFPWLTPFTNNKLLPKYKLVLRLEFHSKRILLLWSSKFKNFCLILSALCWEYFSLLLLLSGNFSWNLSYSTIQFLTFSSTTFHHTSYAIWFPQFKFHPHQLTCLLISLHLTILIPHFILQRQLLLCPLFLNHLLISHPNNNLYTKSSLLPVWMLLPRPHWIIGPFIIWQHDLRTTISSQKSYI